MKSLLRWVLILLVSWNDPLHPPSHRAAGYERGLNTLLSKAKEIEEDNKSTSGRHGNYNWQGEQPPEGFRYFHMNERLTSVMRNVL